MTTETVPAGSRPVPRLKEKRKFNWLVLALLLVIIAIGVARQLL